MPGELHQHGVVYHDSRGWMAVQQSGWQNVFMLSQRSFCPACSHCHPLCTITKQPDLSWHTTPPIAGVLIQTSSEVWRTLCCGSCVALRA